MHRRAAAKGCTCSRRGSRPRLSARTPLPSRRQLGLLGARRSVQQGAASHPEHHQRERAHHQHHHHQHLDRAAAAHPVLARLQLGPPTESPDGTQQEQNLTNSVGPSSCHLSFTVSHRPRGINKAPACTPPGGPPLPSRRRRRRPCQNAFAHPLPPSRTPSHATSSLTCHQALHTPCSANPFTKPPCVAPQRVPPVGTLPLKSPCTLPTILLDGFPSPNRHLPHPPGNICLGNTKRRATGSLGRRARCEPAAGGCAGGRRKLPVLARTPAIHNRTSTEAESNAVLTFTVPQSPQSRGAGSMHGEEGCRATVQRGAVVRR